jgi:hypothetical protein
VNRLLLLPLVARLRLHASGRRVERVLPVARRGLHLALDGGPPGVRIDTRPHQGALLPLASAPPRVRGGRSAWPDIAAAADRDLTGATLTGLRVAPGLSAVRIDLGPAGSVVWETGPPPRIGVHVAGQPPRALPDEAEPPALGEASLLDDLAPVADALERWAGASRGRPEPEDLAALLPGLDETETAALVDAAVRRPAVLGAWIGALRGGPLQVALVGNTAGRLFVDALPADAAPLELEDAAARWYREELEREDRHARRRRASQLLKGERKRVQRALGAVDRDAEKAGDPGALRRLADALLAAGPAAARSPDGRAWQVSDPWQPEVVLDVPIDPPGSSVHQAAERLYGRAKRAERGVEARRERKEALARRRAALQELREQLDAAGDDPDGLDEVEEQLERLGLAARDEHAGAGARSPADRTAKKKRSGPQPSPPARAFTSPGGFRVLVGRSARQNDVLTFKVAAPDDLWLHARERAGAHVVIRTAGAREVPDEDVRFAAGLAAAWSRAPVGEPVEVHVARRKHVRKAKGGPPGQVTVRKSWTVRVVTPRAPSSDDSPD